jgi:hypothetical protein
VNPILDRHLEDVGLRGRPRTAEKFVDVDAREERQLVPPIGGGKDDLDQRGTVQRLRARPDGDPEV